MRSYTFNLLLFVLFFLLPSFSFGQYEDLMKDKNISWIAEFEMDHCFDLNAEELGSNLISLKKFNTTSPKTNWDNGTWLSQWLYYGLFDGKEQAYSDAQMKSPMSEDELLKATSSIDTVITFYPETFEEVVQIVRNDLNPQEIQYYRTRQIIYLEKNSGQLKTRLLAVAPLINDYDSRGKALGQRVLAWIKMKDLLPHDLSLGSPSFSWVATILTKATPLNISRYSQVKGKLNLQKFLYEQATSGKRKVADVGEGFDGGVFLTQEEIERNYASVDTVVTFAPETFVEKVQIVRNEFTPEEVNKIRLVQDWYYDPNQRLLVNRLRAVAPLVEMTNENGEFLYNRPMYYILY